MSVAVITPVKNEEENLPTLVESIKIQTYEPDLWVIIDDSSTDSTPAIIDEVVDKNDFVHSIHHVSENYDVGNNVSEVINAGYNYINEVSGPDIDYYMVVDGDMKLSGSYVEDLIEYISNNNSVVMASGGIYINENGECFLEGRAVDHPAGGAAAFEANFIESIGGFPTVVGWDAAIKAKAKNRGYDCRHLPDLDIKAVQSRRTGGKGSIFKNAMIRGTLNYRQNLHPIVIVLRSIKLSFSSPYYEGLGYLCGYSKSLLKRDEKVADKELRDYFWNKKPKEILKRYIGG